MTPICSVILCGGSGTRLWPLSRKSHPKQFMDIGGDTLFAQTLRRAMSIPESLPPVIICNEEHRFLAAACLQAEENKKNGLSKARILLEPVGRNTAPAVILAALAASSEGEDPLLLVQSSDHIIEPTEAFTASVLAAVPGALDGRIAVFGVPPSRPETGFGYIRQGKELFPNVYEVERFLEKPSRDKAEAMLAEGGHTWNSGIFLFSAFTLLEEAARFAPEMLAACKDLWAGRREDADFTRFDPSAFKACPAESLDYAIMEHTRKACVTPLAAAWSDMGSWEAFHAVAPKDDFGNALHGDIVTLDAKNCYLHAANRMVAAVGVENIAIVETADAVLAVSLDRVQDVKGLMEKLGELGRTETDTHLRVYRPWGSYEVLVMGGRFQVKRIIVNPGARLSLQMHHHRAEHWVVVRGAAKVTVGEREVLLGEDMSTYIPLGTKHRLENPGRIPLEIIEIQTGSYLGEDDIERFDDVYGR